MDKFLNIFPGVIYAPANASVHLCACVHMCEGVYAYVCVYACGGQRSTTGVFLSHAPSYSFRQGIPLIWSSLSGQTDCPPQDLGYRHMPPHPPIM